MYFLCRSWWIFCVWFHFVKIHHQNFPLDNTKNGEKKTVTPKELYMLLYGKEKQLICHAFRHFPMLYVWRRAVFVSHSYYRSRVVELNKTISKLYISTYSFNITPAVAGLRTAFGNAICECRHCRQQTTYEPKNSLGALMEFCWISLFHLIFEK